MPFKIEIIYVERWYSFKQTHKSLISKIQIFHLSSYFGVEFNMCQNEVANNKKESAFAHASNAYGNISGSQLWFFVCLGFFLVYLFSSSLSFSFTSFVSVSQWKIADSKETEKKPVNTGKKSLPNGLSQTLLITIINAHFLNNGLF